ncbi:unnamed protein product [Cuscuta europaea]|uniref:Uncharacterized protein n=1 Tax=Cuscuta europaea TaxID=41803 RepID=A0A9P0Z0S6_CUSEU|nr:unnamed protein product [Cuscuta europaea]
MREAAAAAPSSSSRFLTQWCRSQDRRSPKWSKQKPKWDKIKAQIGTASTYYSRISTNIPLYELPQASFDRYLEDKPRVFKAIFPDKRRSQQLNEEEWRIHMLPIQFLFISALPVVDMRLRCKSKGIAYPPEVPTDVSKVLELDIIRWELQGLDDVVKPSQFSLSVKGALYPERRGLRSRIKGHLEMSISFVLPPVLALLPEHVLQDVAESVSISYIEPNSHPVSRPPPKDLNRLRISLHI